MPVVRSRAYRDALRKVKTIRAQSEEGAAVLAEAVDFMGPCLRVWLYDKRICCSAVQKHISLGRHTLRNMLARGSAIKLGTLFRVLGLISTDLAGVLASVQEVKDYSQVFASMFADATRAGVRINAYNALRSAGVPERTAFYRAMVAR